MRDYLAQIQPQLDTSPLKLQFAYDWSNRGMPDDTLIRKVAETGRFLDLAVICKRHGLERVRRVAADKLFALPSLRRSLANIEQGFARAKEKHTA